MLPMSYLSTTRSTATENVRSWLVCFQDFYCTLSLAANVQKDFHNTMQQAMPATTKTGKICADTAMCFESDLPARIPCRSTPTPSRSRNLDWLLGCQRQQLVLAGSLLDLTVHFCILLSASLSAVPSARCSAGCVLAPLQREQQLGPEFAAACLVLVSEPLGLGCKRHCAAQLII